jgi:hypothetical protein
MDISPAVPTPRKGDPITAEWAAQVAAAANAVPHTPQAPGAFSSPYGSATPAPSLAMLGAWRMPLPFDCVLFNDSGSTKLCIFLPSGTAPYVYYCGKPIDPAQAQTVGDANSGWVELGSAAHGSAHYVYLKWHKDANDEVDGWQVEDTSAPESAGAGTPPYKFLLAWYNIPADGNAPQPGADNKFASGRNGLVQAHRGTVAVSTCEPECPDEYSVTKQTGTLPECVSARYVFKRQRREIDPETGECVDSTGTGSSEETNIDVPEPPEYALSSAGATGCKVTISLTKTPCGGNATSAGSVTLDKAKTYSISEDQNPPSCVDRRYSLDETCDGSTSSVGTIVVPSPPEYSLDSSSATGGTRVDLKMKPCGGTASVVSSVTIPSAAGISGTFLTGLTSLAVTTSGLVLTATTATYVNGSLTATGTTTVTCPVTSC